jgi:hypothetical protein
MTIGARIWQILSMVGEFGVGRPEHRLYGGLGGTGEGH